MAGKSIPPKAGLDKIKLVSSCVFIKLFQEQNGKEMHRICVVEAPSLPPLKQF